MRVVSDCSPEAMVMTGGRASIGAMALAMRTRASGVTPSERARMRASGDLGLETGRRRPCTGDARLVDLAGRDAKRAQQRFAIGVVGFRVEAQTLADHIVADDPAGEGGRQAEPFLQGLFDAVQRIFRQAARFQPVAFQPVDLVQRAGAENAQAHVFGFLSCDAAVVSAADDAFGELGALFVLAGQQQVDRIGAAAFERRASGWRRLRDVRSTGCRRLPSRGRRSSRRRRRHPRCRRRGRAT